MSQIYKFGYNVNNKVTHIFIFIGARLIDIKDDIDLNNLFALEPENIIFKDIFSPDEIKIIKTENISLTFANEQIHLDDTIENIKNKIIKTTRNLNISFGFDIFPSPYSPQAISPLDGPTDK